MIVKPIKTRIFKEGENLVDFIAQHVKKIPEKSVLVITSKIVALSEGRTAKALDEKAKEKLIKSESQVAIKTKYVWLTLKDGSLMATSGIDESNANGMLILLPKNSFKTAEILRKKLMRIYKVKKLGLLITDSRTIPLKAGVVGTCLGYFGFKGIKSYIGTKDCFGRKFKFSRTNIAECLASSAVLCMGEGKERFPLALILDAPVKFIGKINKNETKISIKDDMYFPFLKKLIS